MNDDSEGSADRAAEVDEAWLELLDGLSAYLSGMVDPDELDHLVVELPGGGAEGCTPYVQFASFGNGTMMRAEMSGDAYLLPSYRLADDVGVVVRERGWAGNDEDEPNWYAERPVGDVDVLALDVVGVLKIGFGIAHPQLLTYEAWGPASANVAVLGLCATREVPAEAPAEDPSAGSAPLARVPDDTNDLLMMVAAALRTILGTEPTVDDDGDFVLEHLGQTLRIRVMTTQPTIQILARVAHDVRSWRVAWLLISQLNLEHPYVKWTLREQEVWQSVVFSGLPFAPMHLDALLDIFRKTMTLTRDDLVLRIKADAG